MVITIYGIQFINNCVTCEHLKDVHHTGEHSNRYEGEPWICITCIRGSLGVLGFGSGAFETMAQRICPNRKAVEGEQ